MKRILPMICILGVALCLWATPNVSNAEGGDDVVHLYVKIAGEKINFANYTVEDLRQIGIVEKYSGPDKSGRPSIIVAEGANLRKLLEDNGIGTNWVNSLEISGYDGQFVKYDGAAFIGDNRYRFPLEEPAPSQGSITKDGGMVVPLLSYRMYEVPEAKDENFAEEVDPEKFEAKNGFMFCFGQKKQGEQVAINYGKHIKSIVFVLADGVHYVAPEKPNGSGMEEAAIEEESRDIVVRAPQAEAIDRKGLASETLEIKVGFFGGPYISREIFTTEDIRKLGEIQEAYTYIDNMPAVVIDSVKAVSLSRILSQAGIDVNSVENMHFYCKDVKNSWYQSINKEYLLDTIRYYFPNLPTNWDYDNQRAKNGAEIGKREVPTVIAIEDNWQRFGLNPDYENTTENNKFRLVFGQSDLFSKNAYRSAKWIHTIEVTLGGKSKDAGGSDGNFDKVGSLAGDATEGKLKKEGPRDKGNAVSVESVEKFQGNPGGGLQPWRVFEMAEDASELRVEEMEKLPKRALLWILTMLFTAGTAAQIVMFKRGKER